MMAVIGCISKGNEDEYRVVVNDFVTWCGQNHLNVAKTKEHKRETGAYLGGYVMLNGSSFYLVASANVFI